MLLFVLPWILDLSVLLVLSVSQESLQFLLHAAREHLELKDQNVLLAPKLSLNLWKTVCAQREHQELPVTLTLSTAQSVPLAKSVSFVLLTVPLCLLELSALAVPCVSQRCKLILIVLNALHVSHTHQLKLSALLVLYVKLRNSAHLGNPCAPIDLLE